MGLNAYFTYEVVGFRGTGCVPVMFAITHAGMLAGLPLSGSCFYDACFLNATVSMTHFPSYLSRVLSQFLLLSNSGRQPLPPFSSKVSFSKCELCTFLTEACRS